MTEVRAGAVRALLLLLPLAVAASDDVPSLPEPVTNNAVAAMRAPDGLRVLSALGLGKGRTWKDTSSAAWLYLAGSGWQRLPDVPGPAGRLAAAAIAAGGRFYVFGGYTVAEDLGEVSVETTHVLDEAPFRWRERAPMPVPVDDAVAVVHLDRYVYLVSGWHDLGNVNLVQVYDTAADRWTQATPWPGKPVFGHAGGLVGNTLVVCDGVAVAVRDEGSRRFVGEPACYRGRIDDSDHRRIHWHTMPHHGGPALYRMAAAGSASGGGRVVFAGGSDNPYNYDGIGYDGQPSAPSDRVFAWSASRQRWERLGQLPEATMDHRGLLETGGSFLVIGGMREGQRVTGDVVRFRLP